MLLKDFYSVKSSTNTNDEQITELHINKDHQLYRGHFPGRPVTPGVILMQLFKEEAERLHNVKLRLDNAANVKFTMVVDPNEDENLFLHTSSELADGFIKLKGIAKHKECIALRINALYKIIP